MQKMVMIPPRMLIAPKIQSCKTITTSTAVVATDCRGTTYDFRCSDLGVGDGEHERSENRADLSGSRRETVCESSDASREDFTGVDESGSVCTCNSRISLSRVHEAAWTYRS